MRILTLTLLSIFLIGAGSCRSVQKLAESGDYDRAIELAVKRLKGDKKKDPDVVAGLEFAFNKAQDRDMRAINALRDEGREENWERILSISERIARRQRRVEPLLPLVDKDGYQANFDFVRVDEIKTESKEKTAAYLYDRAERLIGESRNSGDKQLAREAYRELMKITELYRNYRDVNLMLQEAKFVGTNFYLLKVENRSMTILPAQFNDKLTRMSTGEFNSTWREFHLEPVDGIEYDYLMQVLLRRIDVSPETVRERQFDESREMEEGFEYVLDSKGNVMKDSLGNDIKVPKKIFITATVMEVYQHKAAVVSGDLEIINLSTNTVMKSEIIEGGSIFENYAATLLRGDQRALTKDTKARIGRRPLPFPSDADMLLNAADQLQPILRQMLRRFMD